MADKPDPEQFARLLLYHIASLRADLAETQMQLTQLTVHHFGIPSEEEQQEYRKRRADLIEKIYREAVEQAGVKEKPPSPPRDD